MTRHPVYGLGVPFELLDPSKIFPANRTGRPLAVSSPTICGNPGACSAFMLHGSVEPGLERAVRMDSGFENGFEKLGCAYLYGRHAR